MDGRGQVYIRWDQSIRDAVRVVHERSIYKDIYMAYPTPPLFIESIVVMVMLWCLCIRFKALVRRSQTGFTYDGVL